MCDIHIIKSRLVLTGSRTRLRFLRYLAQAGPRYGSRTTNTNTNKRNACSSRSYSRNFLFVSNCSRTFTNVTHKPLHIACDQLHLCVTFVHELFVNKKSLFEFVRVRVRLEFANLFGSGAMSACPLILGANIGAMLSLELC